MKLFPSNLSFRYPWRSYQKRVLHGLDHHLKNRQLHLVAPPWFSLLFSAAIALIVSSPWISTAVKMVMRHQSLERSIREVALVVYTSLYDMELVETEPSLHRLRAEEEGGAVVCWLKTEPSRKKRFS